MGTRKPGHAGTLVWNTAAFCSIAWLLIAEPWLAWLDPERASSHAEARKEILPPPRFNFTIDPRTPLAQLLPVPPETTAAPLPWVISKIVNIPEILFEKTEPAKEESPSNPVARLERAGDRDKATERVAHQIAKINHLNKQRTEPDHFMRLLIENRRDLNGLPFTLGGACRLSADASKQLAKAVEQVHSLTVLQDRGRKDPPMEGLGTYKKWLLEHGSKGKTPGSIHIAALMQILGPAPAQMHVELVDLLKNMNDAESTQALARLAIFSYEDKVRDAALTALKDRPAKAYTDIVKQGLAYPRPEIARNAATAITRLERKDLVDYLIERIDAPEPWAPEERGKKTIVREVVRLNHHRNCLLCHPPANTEDMKLNAFGDTDLAPVGAVPVPGQSFPSSGGYRGGASPDTFVRADITYLRQDFSMMMNVENADPWPTIQRFDFLVREREVTTEEVQAYQVWMNAQGPRYISPWRIAIHDALTSLTGSGASSPTAAAWRVALKR